MAGISVNKCEYCRKTFPTNLPKKRFCSKKCRLEARKEKSELRGHPCWRCKRSILECSWMRNLQPVEGWDAEPVVVADKEGDIRTYKIKSCPKFC